MQLFFVFFYLLAIISSYWLCCIFMYLNLVLPTPRGKSLAMLVKPITTLSEIIYILNTKKLALTILVTFYNKVSFVNISRNSTSVHHIKRFRKFGHRSIHTD